MNDETPSHQVRERVVALGGAALAVAAFASTVVVYRDHAPIGGAAIADFDLGGKNAAARTFNQLHAEDLQDDTHGLAGLVHHLRSTLHWDFVLMAGYAVALLVGIHLALHLVESRRGQRWLRVLRVAAGLAIVADVAENVLLLAGLRGHQTFLGTNVFTEAAVAATLKFTAVVPAGIGALLGVVLAVTRGVMPAPRAMATKPDGRLPLPTLDNDPTVLRFTKTYDSARARWDRGYNVPRCVEHTVVPGVTTGIALSGGGVRAATLALGALQSEGMRGVAKEADYLVSVSGGGYTAGAIAQALSPVDPAADTVVRDAATVFAPGSPEEDHLRRHSSYLADNPLRLVLALALLARHLLLTLVLLFGPAIVLGVLAGRFYTYAPVTRLTLPASSTTNETTIAVMFRFGAWWALGLASGVALLLWLLSQGAAAQRPEPASDDDMDARFGRTRGRLAAAARAMTGLALLVALLVVGVPGVVYVSSWLLHKAPMSVEVASPIGGVLLTYIASVASFGWRNRAKLKIKKGATSVAPKGLVQQLLVMLALLVLALAWLIVFGGMVTVGVEPHRATSTWITLGVIAGACVLLGLFTDETTLSLHPFYRARIASAFAVRRVLRKDGGLAVAKPYPAGERTSLSTYGVAPEGVRFPHIVFAASATVGEQRTAPGSNRVSYTMCAHHVGGPEVGYVASSHLESLVSARLHRDLTVQAAVAISGAAVAASVSGQGSQWYETLLAVSGARLGAWLPNPRFVLGRYGEPYSIRRPGLPRVRRAHYLLRELFGGHPIESPLLQVTDGGYYDNLGLVELFRRRCTRIVCIDASGDAPPAAASFAEALRLAHQELGVTTSMLRDTWTTSAPGGGKPFEPASALAGLNARLSKSGILSGTFEYPDGVSGRIVVAKGALWPVLPYALLAYAEQSTVFPHDSTGDQFFDDQQYEAYTELGRQLGDAAAAAIGRPPAAPVTPRTSPSRSVPGRRRTSW